jgi:hypothetical protein
LKSDLPPLLAQIQVNISIQDVGGNNLNDKKRRNNAAMIGRKISI